VTAVLAGLLGWATGLFVALLVLVALPGQQDRERAMNVIAVALVLGCCGALGIVLALVLST
jgi:hypothetical protein